jgi:release factor glutamine methyltransferase
LAAVAHDDGAVPRPQLRRPLELVKLSAEYLAERGVPAPRLEAELLLAHVLRLSRLRLYLEFERPVVPDELARYRELVRQRGRRVPLQLLTGSAHLLDLELEVRPGVFIPRPETETLIELAAGLFPDAAPPGWLLEVGVGTGGIGIALLRRWPSASAVGFDVNPAAIALAAANATRHGVDQRLRLVLGDPLAAAAAAEAATHATGPGDAQRASPVAGVPRGVDLVVSNPPYVRTGDIPTLAPEVRDHDPHTALDGGVDGLAVIRRLVDFAAAVLRPGGWLAFEHGDDQGEACAAMLRERGFCSDSVHPDLAGRPRVTLGQVAADC